MPEWTQPHHAKVMHILRMMNSGFLMDARAGRLKRRTANGGHTMGDTYLPPRKEDDSGALNGMTSGPTNA